MTVDWCRVVGLPGGQVNGSPRINGRLSRAVTGSPVTALSHAQVSPIGLAGRFVPWAVDNFLPLPFQSREGLAAVLWEKPLWVRVWLGLGSPAVSQTASYLKVTAEAHDAVAVRYATLLKVGLVKGGFDRFPLDRSALAAFADFVRGVNAGPVAELGCGPGHVTAHLRETEIGRMLREPREEERYRRGHLLLT